MRHRSVTYIIKQALIVGVKLEKCADERPQVKLRHRGQSATK